jgi:hypothetical protein
MPIYRWQYQGRRQGKTSPRRQGDKAVDGGDDDNTNHQGDEEADLGDKEKGQFTDDNTREGDKVKPNQGDTEVDGGDDDNTSHQEDEEADLGDKEKGPFTDDNTREGDKVKPHQGGEEVARGRDDDDTQDEGTKEYGEAGTPASQAPTADVKFALSDDGKFKWLYNVCSTSPIFILLRHCHCLSMACSIQFLPPGETKAAPNSAQVFLKIAQFIKVSGGHAKSSVALEKSSPKKKAQLTKGSADDNKLYVATQVEIVGESPGNTLMIDDGKSQRAVVFRRKKTDEYVLCWRSPSCPTGQDDCLYPLLQGCHCHVLQCPLAKLLLVCHCDEQFRGTWKASFSEAGLSSCTKPGTGREAQVQAGL